MERLRTTVGIAFGLVLLGVTAPGVAGAAVRYAAPGGTGPPATCPQTDPCEIEAAVENGMGTPGDEVILLPGTYDIGSATLDVDFDTFMHGQSGSPPPRIVSSSVVANTFEASLMSEVTLESTGPGTTTTTAFGQSTIERVTAIAGGPGARACATPSFLTTFRDSVCWSRQGAGFEIASVVGTLEVPIRNLTAVGGTFGVTAAAAASTTAGIEATNVIAIGALADVRTEGAGTASVALSSSNYDSESEAADAITDPGTAGNQATPPLLTMPASGDFHQVPGSPTIDAGNAGADLLGLADIDGEARIQGPSIDIGADELERIAPQTTITKQPKRRLKTKRKRRRVRLEFIADDPAASFECSLDGRPFAPCASPMIKKVKRGRHRFGVRATDPAGNVDATPAEARWRVKRKRRR